MKSTVVKLVLFLMFVIAVASSCKGPRECWGVSSDAAEHPSEQTNEHDG